jgi:hypothetical protein
VIEDAKFKTYGCGSAIASSSLVTEWVKGKTLDQALAIKNTAIAEELALPPVKIHCSILAEDAIKAAVSDYRTPGHGVATAQGYASCVPRRLNVTPRRRYVRMPIPATPRATLLPAGSIPCRHCKKAHHQRRRGRQGGRDAGRGGRPALQAAHLRHRRRLFRLPVRLHLRRESGGTTTWRGTRPDGLVSTR